jgi:hypothetical protein
MKQYLPARPKLWLLLGLLAAAIAWLFMVRILVPWENYSYVEAGTLKANLGDLYSPWYGTRALLRDRKNPYGPEVTREIQTAFYGHDLVQQYTPGSRIIDEQRFAYPVYAVFLLAPSAILSFETMQTVMPFVLAIAIVACVQLWLSCLRARPGPIISAAITLFVLASPQIGQGLRLRQVGLIVALLLALATWLAIRGNLAAAGAVLAFSTIKPQMIILALAWFLIWSMGNPRQRWRLPAGFLSTLTLLIVAGELILPGWPRDFLNGLEAYRKYTQFTSLLQILLGTAAGAGAAVVIVTWLLVRGWKNRRRSADSIEFMSTLSSLLMATALVLPLTPPFNQSLLILPALMVVTDWRAIPNPARIICGVGLAWPAITSLVLLMAPLSLKSLRPIPLLPLALVLIVPFLLPVVLAMRRRNGTSLSH